MKKELAIKIENIKQQAGDLVDGAGFAVRNAPGFKETIALLHSMIALHDEQIKQIDKMIGELEALKEEQYSRGDV